ncbi:SWIM zinc finger family protein [Embleya sp. NBC_00896]|uniref:SWIM zinc finger family protein n=1 Tax=Embleya sp. NBC_00896 TaxID=2975961 RepID=UPI00386EE1D9|nr:SWIM zinc finger family protein [Embleya sp. NBC_00896]
MSAGPARGFPALAPRKSRGAKGQTWWGRAWTDALEDTALDGRQLRKGRAYANTGRVGPITVGPGRIAAPVYDADGTQYETVVFVEEFDDAQWDRFLDQVAAKAGHIAALLDRDMPQDLVAAAEDADVRLLPGIGDLEPECGCPGWELPCRHAAALCYQVAWLLDRDPFVLLLMRGRDERAFLDLLRDRGVRAPEPSSGVDARTAYRAADPLPEDPPPVAESVQPRFGPAPGIPAGALELLVADAAIRARRMLAGDPADPLGPWPDTVRWAATHDDPLVQANLRDPALPRALAAWGYGGPTGLDTLDAAWTPPAAELARARTALAAAWEDEDAPAFTASHNHWTLTDRGLQLRYGRDGRWYPYRDRAGEWWPAGDPDRDPGAALVAVA